MEATPGIRIRITSGPLDFVKLFDPQGHVFLCVRYKNRAVVNVSVSQKLALARELAHDELTKKALGYAIFSQSFMSPLIQL